MKIMNNVACEDASMNLTTKNQKPSVARSLWLAPIVISAALSSQIGKAQSATNPSEPPAVVQEVDLGRYIGTWYEIASNRPDFQKDCFCTTAEYSLIDAAIPTIGVRNSCNRGSVAGPRTTVDGRATIPDLSTPAKLAVTFGGPFPANTNYWIVSLAEDYSYAVVSAAERKPIFILARQRQLSQATTASILTDLEQRGFDTSILDYSVQIGCN
jgi:apolipoprotein D and lipocalin family protein